MKKWLLITAALAVLIAAAAVWFYQSARSGFETAEQQAVEIALAHSSLAIVDQVAHYAGDAPYVIVFGRDEAEEPLIVWVGGGEVHERKAADGIAESRLRELLEEQSGPVEPIRLTPGVWNGQLVWEAFYKKEETDGFHYYYDYYRFSDGTWLDTYRLGAE